MRGPVPVTGDMRCRPRPCLARYPPYDGSNVSFMVRTVVPGSMSLAMAAAVHSCYVLECIAVGYYGENKRRHCMMHRPLPRLSRRLVLRTAACATVLAATACRRSRLGADLSQPPDQDRGDLPHRRRARHPGAPDLGEHRPRASRSWSTTSRAPAATSAPTSSPRRPPTATRW